MEQFQEENKKQIEHQKSIAKQIVAMKNVATTLHTDVDEIFENNMQHLEEEHRYQLQHQAEMMCQVAHEEFLNHSLFCFGFIYRLEITMKYGPCVKFDEIIVL